MKTINFIAEGTTCHSCEELIKKQALKIDGVEKVDFDFRSQTGTVTFDENKTDIDTILYKMEEKGYQCFIEDNSNEKTLDRNEEEKLTKATIAHTDNSDTKKKNQWGWIFALAGILIAGYFILSLTETIAIPQIGQNMGYWLLFIVGLLTGFHCIAMCGGFVVSYTAKNAQEGKSPHLAHIKYASGKLISYTAIGAIFGLLGSIIAFTPRLRGFAGVLAGLFLVVFGLRMLNIFPGLRKFSIRFPSLSKLSGKQNSPLMIGLLNGLMIACGPLQAIYIMAAGTGSMIEGAKLLFVFALGTLPVMLGFGYFTSFISSKLTQKILKASGAIVILLGFIMINNGLVLTGSGLDFKSLVTPVNTYASPGTAVQNQQNIVANNVAVLKESYQEIHMDVTADGWSPDYFVLKKGVPVKWIINAKEITSCNKAIQMPSYNLNFDLKPGLQTIEFTPDKEGTIRWSCWMGMIQGTFIVTSDLSDANVATATAATATGTSVSKVPACGMSGSGGTGGGCGCGMMK